MSVLDHQAQSGMQCTWIWKLLSAIKEVLASLYIQRDAKGEIGAIDLAHIAGIFAHRADSSAISIENKWNWNQDDREESEDASSPRYTESAVHRSNEQRKGTSHRTPQERIRRDRAGGIELKGVDEII